VAGFFLSALATLKASNSAGGGGHLRTCRMNRGKVGGAALRPNLISEMEKEGVCLSDAFHLFHFFFISFLFAAV
jgi:hypothetical protein